MSDDTLTNDGIATDYQRAESIRADYEDLHGEPVHDGDDRVVFADRKGHELSEWADVLGMERGELAETMHELAREVCDYSWSASDPVVFDAETFQEGGA